MGAVRRPFKILPAREREEVELRAQPIALVRHACEACGELTNRGVLCAECADQARPHVPGDPYDDLGGEDGWE